MSTERTTKIRHAHSLMYKAHVLKSKRELLAGFGYDHITDMPDTVLDEFIEKLKELADAKKTDADVLTRQWRHKVLRMVSACGVDTQDWENVNNFLLSNRIAGKHLYKCTVPELMTLHRKLQNVAPKMQEQRERAIAKAQLN